jgi:nicotinamidase-related amidase
MNAINSYCPRSGKPVTPESLTQYRGVTVGFCNPGCRDDFAADPAECPEDRRYFDAVIKERGLWDSFPVNDEMPVEFSDNTALVLVDIQKAFDHPKWGNRNNPDAERNAARLLAAWRETSRPIVHIRHINKKPGSLFHPDAATSLHKEEAKPLGDEPIITKEVNSSFIGTNLEQWLRDHGCEAVVIAGISTPHCVATTTRMAGNLGFDTYIVADATAAFALPGPDGKLYPAEEIHRVNLVALHDEFATVVNTDSAVKAANKREPERSVASP